MKQEIAEVWVDRLRNGGIPQARGLLGQGEKRCCLGVLCDIAVERGVVGRKDFGVSETQVTYAYGNEEDTDLLPIEVMEWAGIDSTDGRYVDREQDRVHTLTDLNDNEMLDFPAIAAVIEDYWEEL